MPSVRPTGIRRSAAAAVAEPSRQPSRDDARKVRMPDRMTGPGFELTRTERGGHAFVRFGRGSREAAHGGDRRITPLPAAVAAAKSAAA